MLVENLAPLRTVVAGFFSLTHSDTIRYPRPFVRC